MPIRLYLFNQVGFMLNTDKKIAIVGAGLVGSLLSIYLTKRGYAVSVFERRPDLRTNILLAGRSINMALSNRGLAALHEVGLAERVKQVAVPMNGRMVHPVKGKINFQAYGDEGQHINSISRNELNVFLVDEATNLGVEFFFEHQCLDVDFEKTELVIQHSASIIYKPFDVIIGADGAYSAVRNAMQMTDRFNFYQRYIEHGYKELTIPTDDKGQAQLEKNSLHIWPRESFMLIALPNADNTFTCTLFLPFEGDPSFEKLKHDEDVQAFFDETFPDAACLMPTLIEDYRNNPTASLVTVQCDPWLVKKALLIGDAAHGIVPFFGQGMNAGFEDCHMLNKLLNQYNDDWTIALNKFQNLRKPDADAIAELAMDNFIEMRDLVADPDFIVRKKIETKLHELYPDKWIPLYSMVTFHENIRYSEAKLIGEKQKKIMDEVMQKLTAEEKWEHLNFHEIVNKL
jgi:kynurenine 3-monooxygenase